MSKYKESSVVGESWKRSFQVLIENIYGQTPKIRFSEEEIFVASDGRLAGGFNGEGIEEFFTPENASNQFQLRNPITEEYTDQYATYQDVYILIHSLYFHLAKLRDRGPQPYPSWTFNELTEQWKSPVPKPNDEQTYFWDEVNQTWNLSE